MADITQNASEYSSDTIDTASTLDNESTSQSGDEIRAEHINGPTSAIIQIETVLGTASSLIGAVADLATRLLVALETNGKLKNFSSTTKTTHPGTVTEGMTGATSFTASELLRKHASNDVLESTGLTVGETPGVVSVVAGAETLTNKTLTTPTIGDQTNMNHDHSSVSEGGAIANAHVTQPRLSTTTASLSGGGPGTVTNITLNSYPFFPMIHCQRVDSDGGGNFVESSLSGHTTDGASPDNPRFRIVEPVGSSGGGYNVDYRYVTA